MFDNEGMKQIVAAAVVSALEDKAPALLAELINKVLDKKVDSSGHEPRYSSEAKGTLLEWMASNQMEILVRQAVMTWFEGRAAEIKEAVTARLTDGGVADALVTGLLNSLGDYRLKVDLTMERD